MQAHNQPQPVPSQDTLASKIFDGFPCSTGVFLLDGTLEEVRVRGLE